MTEKLILTAAAIRTTNFDVERQAKSIVKTMIESNRVEVSTPRNWLKNMFVRRDSHSAPTRSEYEAKIEAAIKGALDFELKKHLAIGERKFRWTEPARDTDGYLEFFYNDDFLRKVSGKNTIYWNHPYQSEMMHYYDEIGIVPLNDVEKHLSTDLSRDMYEKVMPRIMQEFHRYWIDSSSMRQNLAALEEIVSKELRFLPSRLEDSILEKVEFRTI